MQVLKPLKAIERFWFLYGNNQSIDASVGVEALLYPNEIPDCYIPPNPPLPSSYETQASKSGFVGLCIPVKSINLRFSKRSLEGLTDHAIWRTPLQPPEQDSGIRETGHPPLVSLFYLGGS
jgi:hypothetical protein